MDKELEKMLKELNGVLGDFLKNNKDKMCKEFEKAFEKALKEECELSIKVDKNGVAGVKMNGGSFSLLIALAGLEKAVLERVNAPSGLFEIIKDSLGSKEAE